MAIWDWSKTAASNTSLESISWAEGQSPSTVNDGVRAIAAALATFRDEGRQAAEVSVASAATTDILAAVSPLINITGTTTITSFGTGINRVRFVRFAAALTLTHNATSLILPGGANITTAAGDTCVVVSDASSNCRVVNYQRASGLSIGVDLLTGDRNRIINGNFDFWQRETSQTSSGYGSDDRWNNNHSGSTKTHSQQSFAPGQTDVPGNPAYFSRTEVIAGAGTSDFVAKTYKIEKVASLSGKTATLTFWVKCDTANPLAVEFLQSFGTGGTPSATVNAIEVTTVSTSVTWQKVSFTVDIPSISGKTLGTNGDDYLQFSFWFDAGTTLDARTNSLGHRPSGTHTYDIARVSLVEGDATAEDDPFSPRHLGQELALCQRYYEKSYALATKPASVTSNGSVLMYYEGALTGASAQIFFRQEKRAAPTVTGYNPTTGATGTWYDSTRTSSVTINLEQVSTNGCWCYVHSLSSGNISTRGHWTADAEL